jgi:hypothetical protein
MFLVLASCLYAEGTDSFRSGHSAKKQMGYNLGVLAKKVIFLLEHCIYSLVQCGLPI